MWGDVFCSPEEGTGVGLGMDMGHYKRPRFSPSPTPPIMALGTLGSYNHNNRDSLSTATCQVRCQVPAKCADI